MKIECIYEVKEHHEDEAPETFGHVRFAEQPKIGEQVMLKWIDGRDAYEVVVTHVEPWVKIDVSRDPIYLARRGLPAVSPRLTPRRNLPK